jgi:predicted PurR-regulated permease PerM
MSRDAILRTILYAVGAPMLVIAALSLGAPYMTPIAVAVLIWFLINAMADGLRRFAPGLPTGVAKGASLALLFVLLAVMAQGLANNLASLAAALSELDARLASTVNRGLSAIGLAGRIDFAAIIASIPFDALARDALDAARELAGDVSLVFLYVMFLLIDQRYYDAKLAALYPDAARRDALRVTLRRVASEVRAYLWLMSLLSAGVGIATYALCAAFGLSAPGFWGFLAFGLNFIPTIGSILAVVFPSLFALIQFDSDGASLGLVAALGAVQFIAGEFVLPRLMGGRLNLSTFVILLSLVVWGAMWGPVGMFLAIPIMVILMIVFAEFDQTRPIAIALSRTGGLAQGAPKA